MPLLLMNESNNLVLYSTRLSYQIPPSYAAHAFNQFQLSMHLFELLRLCAMWDKPSKDGESIPTILALYCDRRVIHKIIRDTAAAEENLKCPDGVDNASANRWWCADRTLIAKVVAAEVRKYLFDAAKGANVILKSPKLARLRYFRNNYIAHNLQTETTGKKEVSVERLKYKDETEILEQTIGVADALYHGLNRTSFDWVDARRIARRNAQALWEHCRFDIPFPSQVRDTR